MIAGAALLLGMFAEAARPAFSAMMVDVVPDRDRLRAFSLNYWAINLGFACAGDPRRLRRRGRLPAALRGRRGHHADHRGDRLLQGAARPGRSAARSPAVGVRAAPAGLRMVLATGSSSASSCAQPVHRAGLPAAHLDAADRDGRRRPVPGHLRLGDRAQRRPDRARPALRAPADPGPAAARTCSRWPPWSSGVGFGLTAFAGTAPGSTRSRCWSGRSARCSTRRPTRRLIAELSPADMRGRYQGVFSLSWSVAAFAAPVLGGFVREHLGNTTLWLGCAALAFVVGGRPPGVRPGPGAPGGRSCARRSRPRPLPPSPPHRPAPSATRWRPTASTSLAGVTSCARRVRGHRLAVRRLRWYPGRSAQRVGSMLRRRPPALRGRSSGRVLPDLPGGCRSWRRRWRGVSLEHLGRRFTGCLVGRGRRGGGPRPSGGGPPRPRSRPRVACARARDPRATPERSRRASLVLRGPGAWSSARSPLLCTHRGDTRARRPRAFALHRAGATPRRYGARLPTRSRLSPPRVQSKRRPPPPTGRQTAARARRRTTPQPSPHRCKSESRAVRSSAGAEQSRRAARPTGRRASPAPRPTGAEQEPRAVAPRVQSKRAAATGRRQVQGRGAGAPAERRGKGLARAADPPNAGRQRERGGVQSKNYADA